LLGATKEPKAAVYLEGEKAEKGTCANDGVKGAKKAEKSMSE